MINERERCSEVRESIGGNVVEAEQLVRRDGRVGQGEDVLGSEEEVAAVRQDKRHMAACVEGILTRKERIRDGAGDRVEVCREGERQQRVLLGARRDSSPPASLPTATTQFSSGFPVASSLTKSRLAVSRKRERTVVIMAQETW